MANDQDPQELGLSRLFTAYREACPDPEPSSAFMPRLWEKIEGQQCLARDLKRLAQGLVTAAAAVSLLMAIVLLRSEGPVSFYTSTYVEVLADDNEAGEAGIVPVAQDTY